jgi:GNAT superfamily N-acetyltransferase
MSFWKDSPGPSWTDCFWSICSCAGLPLAQPVRKIARTKPNPSKYSYELAKLSEATEILEFLHTYFKITEASTCDLPVDRLLKGLQSDWIFVIARDNGKLIGTIASRYLGAMVFQVKVNMEPKKSSFPTTDFIDFFCVHPDYQKMGVGSELLKYIDYHANQKGRMIHFFTKELTPLWNIPPLWSGIYIFREAAQTATFNPRIKGFTWIQKHETSKDFEIRFQTQRPSIDTKYFVNDCGNFKLSAAITNTYHTFKNSLLGELLFYSVDPVDEKIENTSIAAAIEDIIESSGYRFILMDETVPHLKQMNWQRDSAYYIYSYNVNPRKFFTVKPELWF